MRFSLSILSIIIILSLNLKNGEELEYSKKESIFEYSNSNYIQLPNSIKMYECIDKYSKKYNVPDYIAYNVAYLETRYKGPFHGNINTIKSLTQAL